MNNDEFGEQVLTQLKEMIKSHASAGLASSDTHAWLQTFFKHYSDRMLSDNERIWRTGAIFVPISLAAFGALTTIKCLHFWHVLLLAVTSLLLMSVWLVIAENHRAFQQKSEAWLIAIQRATDLEPPSQVKLKATGMERFVTMPGAIQRMRWYLFYAVAVTWIALLAVAGLGWLPSECQVVQAAAPDRRDTAKSPIVSARPFPSPQPSETLRPIVPAAVIPSTPQPSPQNTAP